MSQQLRVFTTLPEVQFPAPTAGCGKCSALPTGSHVLFWLCQVQMCPHTYSPIDTHMHTNTHMSMCTHLYILKVKIKLKINSGSIIQHFFFDN